MKNSMLKLNTVVALTAGVTICLCCSKYNYIYYVLLFFHVFTDRSTLFYIKRMCNYRKDVTFMSFHKLNILQDQYPTSIKLMISRYFY